MKRLFYNLTTIAIAMVFSCGIFQIPVNNVVKPFLKVLYNLVVIKSTNTIRKGGYHEIYASSRFNSGCSYQYSS